jgi:hypothetical protein
MAENEEQRKTPPPEGKQPYRDKEAGMRHDAEPERQQTNRQRRRNAQS